MQVSWRSTPKPGRLGREIYVILLVSFSQAVVHISFSERRDCIFMVHCCYITHVLSLYKHTCSQQPAKQTQALYNTLSTLDETVSGDLCTLTGWWAWVFNVCVRVHAHVLCGWVGAWKRMASLESSSICSPDCNRRLWLLGLYYKIWLRLFNQMRFFCCLSSGRSPLLTAFCWMV